MPRPSSSTLIEPSACIVTAIFVAWPPRASSAALSIISWMMCSGLSVRVYMPGRARTGSRPFRTLIDCSSYFMGNLERRGAAPDSPFYRQRLGHHLQAAAGIDQRAEGLSRRARHEPQAERAVARVPEEVVAAVAVVILAPHDRLAVARTAQRGEALRRAAIHEPHRPAAVIVGPDQVA